MSTLFFSSITLFHFSAKECSFLDRRTCIFRQLFPSWFWFISSIFSLAPVKNLVNLVSIFLHVYPIFSSSYTCFLLKYDFIKYRLLLQAASVFLQKCVTWWIYLEDGEGQKSLACCSPWGYKESDTTEWLICLTEQIYKVLMKVDFNLINHAF